MKEYRNVYQVDGAVTNEMMDAAVRVETPQALIRPRQDVRSWLTAYAKAGGPHHLAVAQGDARAALRALAGWLGADYSEI